MEKFADPRETFAEALLEAAKKDSRIVALSADSSSGSGFSPFKKNFPDRHLEFGIMEQGVVGFASGLATMGKIPVVATIATFVTSRPFEMVRNDLGYMRQNVKLVGRCGGITYNDLGPTHHSLEDFAILGTIPGFTLLSPGDPLEIRKATLAMFEHVGPVYMRIGQQPIPFLYEGEYPFQIGKGITMREGKDLTIVATGTVLQKAIAASDLLKKRGIHTRVINIHTLKPIDREILVQAARETGKIVTVEENYLRGGLGSLVAQVVSTEYPVPVRMIGIDDTFVGTGPYEDLLAKFGLQPEQIAETAVTFLRK
ncbi:MAG: transketolase [Spirochaetes bacterium]|nr:transketolase [Spirochaetota bacterium]